MARELAKRVGYVYVDSGAMYRAVTLYALRHGMVNADHAVNRKELVAALPSIHVSFQPAGADGVQHTLLNGEDVEKEIRDMQVSALVSPVAEIPEVRERLVDLQKKFGEHKGIVMDGRDIGTTVFPNAEMKVFVTASPETRAQRRFKELTENGTPAKYEDVLANVIERDRIDETRAESPLRKAPDAEVLDNSCMTHAEQSAWLLDMYHKALTKADERNY